MLVSDGLITIPLISTPCFSRMPQYWSNVMTMVSASGSFFHFRNSSQSVNAGKNFEPSLLETAMRDACIWRWPFSSGSTSSSCFCKAIGAIKDASAIASSISFSVCGFCFALNSAIADTRAGFLIVGFFSCANLVHLIQDLSPENGTAQSRRKLQG